MNEYNIRDPIIMCVTYILILLEYFYKLCYIYITANEQSDERETSTTDNRALFVSRD